MEYLHVHLGDFVYGSFAGDRYRTSGNFNVVRAGLNYRFASGKAPIGKSPTVVTKY